MRTVGYTDNSIYKLCSSIGFLAMHLASLPPGKSVNSCSLSAVSATTVVALCSCDNTALSRQHASINTESSPP